MNPFVYKNILMSKNLLRELNFAGVISFIALARIPFTRRKNKRIEILLKLLSHYPRVLSHNKILKYCLTCYKDDVNILSQKNEVDLLYSIILKPYISKKEKGIILISFETELNKLLNFKKFYNIQSRYHIIFIPSWTGLYSTPLLKLAVLSKDRFYVMPVHKHEDQLCHKLGENCKPLPFNAASWVKTEFFSGYKKVRDINCLMVANFGEYKRHWILFKALSKLPIEISACCVGVPLGDGKRTADSLRYEAKIFGVYDRVEIVENPTQPILREYFQRAKVFCALSYKEGSYIGVAEALMAGTPVVMFKNAKIGTKALISPSCGALVSTISELREKILFYNKYDAHASYKKIRSGFCIFT